MPVTLCACGLSVRQLATFIQRFNSAETPYQRTRWRIVLCGDDSLLVHAEESQQTGVVNLWSTLYKTYRKAHNLIVLGVTIGSSDGTFFFPLWVELWRQPSLRKQTRPQRMAAALLRLQEQLKEYSVSLDGIDLVVLNGYLRVDRKHRPAIGLATLRRDGFVSLDAGSEPGSVLTKPFRLTSSDLHLNVDAQGGQVTLAICDASGMPLPGLGCSEPITGDNLDAIVRWRNSENAFPFGKEICLRIDATRAKLYSFWF